MTLQSHGSVQERDEIGEAIVGQAPWFHNLHLPSGHQTAPDHPLGDFPSFKWRQIAPELPQDLNGCRVLDIGCNAGFYSFAVAERGAEIVGIDVDPHYLAQARWARSQFGFDAAQVRFEQMQVYDLARMEGTFDIVLFLGVLYHLRYPLLALDLVASKVGGTLVVQSLSMPGEKVAEAPENIRLHERDLMLQEGWPAMAFIEHRLEDDDTNWWAPNRACLEAMLRSTGMEVVARPGHEIYVCRRSHPIRPFDLDAVLAAGRETQ